jgi:hypothetical protein
MAPRRAFPALLAVVVLVTIITPLAPARAQVAKWVVAENARQGTRSWRIPAGTPADIQGFANKVSAQRQDDVTLYVDTPAGSFHVVAYRLGYYQGLGGRRIWTSKERPGVQQAAPVLDQDTNMVECHWKPSLTFHIGAKFVQGSYLLKLVASSGGESYVPFVVRRDASDAALVIQHQVFTWQAYNDWGGYSLYHGPGGFGFRSRVVSFDRPYTGTGAAGMLRAMPVISLVEQEGMDVTYSTDRDLQLRPALLSQHRALVTLNHSEYWSTAMRDAVEAARSSGTNLIFLGANGIFRHIRVEASPLGAARHVVCYKDAAEDPLTGVNNSEVTVNWRDSPVLKPESAVLGGMYHCFGVRHDDMVVPDASPWIYAGAGLQNGSHIPGAVDGEIDHIYPNSPTPASIQVLAHSSAGCEDETSVSDMTYYTASSGAGVLDVGSLGWYETLRCGVPVSGPWCSAAAVTITENVRAAAAAGPLGFAHPSKPNAASFGYTLTNPTHP